MKATRTIALGAWLTGLAVVSGAFGAHGLKDLVDAQGMQWWQTAVQYHAAHALGLVIYGLYAERRAAPAWIAHTLWVGCALFSGTLYAMALGGPRWLGAITPLGGTLWIVAWLGFGWCAWRESSRPS